MVVGAETTMTVEVVAPIVVVAAAVVVDVAAGPVVVAFSDVEEVTPDGAVVVAPPIVVVAPVNCAKAGAHPRPRTPTTPAVTAALLRKRFI
jgi:hypothetical protein